MAPCSARGLLCAAYIVFMTENMNDIAREKARKDNGEFGKRARSAPEAGFAPTKETDPRYEAGVSEFDDDMTDAEWFEAYGAPDDTSVSPAPFVFDKNYDNYEQVRPYMDEFNRVHDELLDPKRGFVYNDDFVGKLPSLAGTAEKDEKTAIYMLQSLRRINDENEKLAAFLASGGVPMEDVSVTGSTPVRGDIAAKGWYVGGTGWKVIEDVRLLLLGNQIVYSHRGKRRMFYLPAGTVYFRAAS